MTDFIDRASDTRHHRFMLIYKIFRAPEWAELRHYGVTAGAPVDVTDGYVHFSTAEQVRETCAKFFFDQNGLVLLACDADRFGPDLKWEPSRGGALFPHLYRSLQLSDVLWHHPLPRGEHGHVFPENLE